MKKGCRSYIYNGRIILDDNDRKRVDMILSNYTD